MQAIQCLPRRSDKRGGSTSSCQTRSEHPAEQGGSFVANPSFGAVPKCADPDSPACYGHFIFFRPSDRSNCHLALSYCSPCFWDLSRISRGAGYGGPSKHGPPLPPPSCGTGGEGPPGRRGGTWGRCLLRAGNKVPADARILEAYNLQIEEAVLTGESVPSEKQTGNAGKSSVAYR